MEAEILEGEPRLHDHEEVRWIKLEETSQLDFAPADVKVANAASVRTPLI